MTIAKDFSKQLAVTTDQKAMKQINFDGNTEEIPTIFFFIFEFPRRNCTSILNVIFVL